MKSYELTESELKFARLIWDHEPIRSGDLVKLSEKEMDWKKSTTYTVIKNLELKGVVENLEAVVTSLISEEEYQSSQSVQFVEESFGGSLAKFLTAFMRGKKISSVEARKLKQLIDDHKEVEGEERQEDDEWITYL